MLIQFLISWLIALWREMKFHKLLLLNGEGRNGKGTLCKVITRFLG